MLTNFIKNNDNKDNKGEKRQLDYSDSKDSYSDTINNTEINTTNNETSTITTTIITNSTKKKKLKTNHQTTTSNHHQIYKGEKKIDDNDDAESNINITNSIKHTKNNILLPPFNIIDANIPVIPLDTNQSIQNLENKKMNDNNNNYLDILLDIYSIFHIDTWIDMYLPLRDEPLKTIKLKKDGIVKGDDFLIPKDIENEWPLGLEYIVTYGITTKELNSININPYKTELDINFCQGERVKEILNKSKGVRDVIERSFLDEGPNIYKVIYMDTDLHHQKGWIHTHINKKCCVPYMHYYIKKVKGNNQNNIKDKWWFVVCSFALIKYYTFSEDATLFENAKYEYVDLVCNYRYHGDQSPLINLGYCGYEKLKNIWLHEIRGIGKQFELAFLKERIKRGINIRLLYADEEDDERTPYWFANDFVYLKDFLKDEDVLLKLKNLNFTSSEIDELYDELTRIGEPGDDYSEDLMITYKDSIKWIDNLEPFDWSSCSAGSDDDDDDDSSEKEENENEETTPSDEIKKENEKPLMTIFGALWPFLTEKEENGNKETPSDEIKKENETDETTSSSDEIKKNNDETTSSSDEIKNNNDEETSSSNDQTSTSNEIKKNNNDQETTSCSDEIRKNNNEIYSNEIKKKKKLEIHSPETDGYLPLIL